MATITRVRGARGTSYRAQIRIKRQGRIVHSEAKTFSTRRLAQAWAGQREAELAEPGALDRIGDRTTWGELIERYDRDVAGEYGRTKQRDIAKLARSPIAGVRLRDTTSARLIEHVRERREAGAGPATVNNDLIWLRTVAKDARRAWGVSVDLQAIDDAAATAREKRLIGKPNERERRVSDDELAAVCAQLERKLTTTPLSDIVWFAVYSARRQAEITRLLWADYDGRTVLVRDLKDPRRKDKSRRAALTPEARAIIDRQPESAPEIFPYNAKTIGTYFRHAVRLAEIPDLRFHDLRHEATSRLFERGHSIQEVQLFTLHDSWKTLQRYTNLRPEEVPDR